MLDDRKNITWYKPGATISTRDKTVKALDFYENIKIFYLPDNVAGSFPNLEIYDARSCSLKKIKKINFDGLFKLKDLSLGENEIEKIASDTFKGLVNLEIIGLGRKIQLLFLQFLI